MVLAMFVDANRVSLLSALAGGSVYVTPSVIDPTEVPPFTRQPVAEFARGVFAAQRDLAQPLHATRVQRRTAFYRAVGATWSPVSLSGTELRQARYFVSPAARATARLADPTLRVKRISAGEAEAAAVALVRGWTLWSDDSSIINLLAALHPGQPVERMSDLVVSGADEGLLACQEAADLYNELFVGQLGLYSKIVLRCQDDQVVL